MNGTLKDVLVITRKELTHFFRDPHVLIYSLLFPLLGFPLLIIGSFETMLWQESLAGKKTVKIAITRPAPGTNSAVFDAIARSPRFEVKACQDPIDSLNRGEIDAALRPGQAGTTMEVLVNDASDKTEQIKLRIAEVAHEEDSRAVKEALKSAGRDPDFLTIFTVELRNLAPIAVVSSYLLPCVCGFALVMVGFGATYPAVCAFPEEREKRTLDSTLMLPVNRFSVVLGKTTAVFLVGLMSGAINLFSMVAVFWVLSIQPNVQTMITKLGGGSLFGNFQLSQLAMILCCLVSIAAETAAIFMFAAQAARSFKEGQNILTIPLLTMTLTPVVLALPGMELTWQTALVPVLNIVLSLRSIFSGSCNMPLCMLSLAQNFVISVLLIFWIGKTVGREEFLQENFQLTRVLTGGKWHKR